MKHIHYDLEQEIAEYARAAAGLDAPAIVHRHLSFLLEMRDLRIKLQAEGCDWLVGELDRTMGEAYSSRIQNVLEEARAEWARRKAATREDAQ